MMCLRIDKNVASEMVLEIGAHPDTRLTLAAIAGRETAGPGTAV